MQKSLNRRTLISVNVWIISHTIVAMILPTFSSIIFIIHLESTVLKSRAVTIQDDCNAHAIILGKYLEAVWLILPVINLIMMTT